jgi:hypothetical protein
VEVGEFPVVLEGRDLVIHRAVAADVGVAFARSFSTMATCSPICAVARGSTSAR